MTKLRIFLIVSAFFLVGGPASARYYEPSEGRFLQEDPILLPMPVFTTQDVQSINATRNQYVWLRPGLLDVPMFQHPYAYTANNPLKYTDPYGLLYGIPAGELYGEDSAQYWADLYAETGNPLYWFPGGFASLWTPCTSDKTFTTVAAGYAASKFFRFDPPHHGLGPHDHFGPWRFGPKIPGWGKPGSGWEGWIDWIRKGAPH